MIQEVKELSDEDKLTNKYKDLIDSTNLEGLYQKLQFLLVILIGFAGNSIILVYPLNKELPEYYCFNKLDFQENAKFNIYKNTNNYDIIFSEHCIERYCKNKVPNYKDADILVLVVDNYSEVNLII